MDISRIDASLEDGRLLQGGYLAIFYIGMIIPLILPLIAIVLIVISFFVEYFWDVYTVVIITLLIICGSGASGGFAYLIFQNRQKKKKILLYLTDAKAVKAVTQTIGTFRGIGQPLKEVKIQVSFTFEGVAYTRNSGKAESKRIHNGYDKVFAKYADRRINILYSEQYDQVLIVKDAIT